MTPIERAMRFANMPMPNSFGIIIRIVWFFVLQVFALTIFFWAGIFTLVAAIWHGDPNYIWIFLLLVTGFELLALRIIFRRGLLVILGIACLAGGIYLHHSDSINYNERTCHFIKQSTCHEWGDGFICRRESGNIIMDRTITHDDVSACNRLDEL